MPRFAANISTMFGEWDLIDRIGAAADCGFAAVECQFPYAVQAIDLAERLDRHRMELVLLNAPAGNMAAGERGYGALPGADEAFELSVETALVYAETTRCPRVHVMAGAFTDANPGGPSATARFVDRIGQAADRALTFGVDICIEPMNHRDVPGYFLGSSRQAERIIAAVGRPNVKLQFDTYHLQIQEGDLVENFRRTLPLIGHVQFSSLPGRHEPDGGELDHHWLFATFDELGYRGWLGCEYRPRAGTLEGLGWAERYGIRPATTG